MRSYTLCIGSNLTIINSTKHADIIERIKNKADLSRGAHFTNDTYAYSAEMIVPTTLAGFHYVLSQQPDLPIIVAINSDKSMKALGKTGFETQDTRAKKIAVPLHLLFPNTPIFIIFYDETTPNTLYKALNKAGFTKTLHKWGYGTTPQSPKVEGAELFDSVYGFPLPNDKEPVCFRETKLPSEPQKINVVDLRDWLITTNSKLKIKLPKQLKQYCCVEPGLIDQAREYISNNMFGLFFIAGTFSAGAAAYIQNCSEETDSLGFH